jgi:hypothetical protein
VDSRFRGNDDNFDGAQRWAGFALLCVSSSGYDTCQWTPRTRREMPHRNAKYAYLCATFAYYDLRDAKSMEKRYFTSDLSIRS